MNTLAGTIELTLAHSEGKMSSKPKFHVGQIVCIRGMEPPEGLVVLKRRLKPDLWFGTVEQDNKPDDREWTAGELRALTGRESGYVLLPLGSLTKRERPADV